MEIEFTTDDPAPAAAATSAEASDASTAAASSAALAASAAPAVRAAPATPAARLESHLTTALQSLYKSALIVEQGVAQPAPSTSLDPQLERLMGIAQPAMKHADMTNQNLQRQLSANNQHSQSGSRGRSLRNSRLMLFVSRLFLLCVSDLFLSSLQSIDHVAREMQISVPKAIIESDTRQIRRGSATRFTAHTRSFLSLACVCVCSCVDHGENPSALTGRLIDETRSQNESVRAQIFATKMLHDQLALRMELWDQVLEKEAQAGNEGAKNLLRDSAVTNDLKQETRSL